MNAFAATKTLYIFCPCSFFAAYYTIPSRAVKVLPNPAEQASSQDVKKWLEGLNDEDLGRYKM